MQGFKCFTFDKVLFFATMLDNFFDKLSYLIKPKAWLFVHRSFNQLLIENA